MTFDELKEKAHSLPLKPGVYIMQDAQSKVIYVGKAKALKNRVSQYFANLASHTEKTRAMVSQIDHFDVIIADSEFEALVLENSLIKRHQPRYNILLKDDKGYPYIRLSQGGLSKIFPGQPGGGGRARYFGPYASRHSHPGHSWRPCAVRPAPALLPGESSRGTSARSGPASTSAWAKCDGYCRPRDGPEAVTGTSPSPRRSRLLEGPLRGGAARTSPAEMEPGRWRTALREGRRAAGPALSHRAAGQAAEGGGGLPGGHRRGGLPQGGATRSCFVVLHYVEGDLAAKDRELLETPMEEDEEEVLSSLIREYYGGRTRLPKQILLPCELSDQVPLTRMLSEQVGYRVELVTPQRGAKMDLIKLANQNAVEEVERATTREERQNKLLEALGKMLGLGETPRRMESYDISNPAPTTSWPPWWSLRTAAP